MSLLGTIAQVAAQFLVIDPAFSPRLGIPFLEGMFFLPTPGMLSWASVAAGLTIGTWLARDGRWLKPYWIFEGICGIATSLVLLAGFFLAPRTGAHGISFPELAPTLGSFGLFVVLPLCISFMAWRQGTLWRAPLARAGSLP